MGLAFTKVLKALALFCPLLVLSVGCSSEQSKLESELCEIYKTVNQREIKNLSSREGELAESIQSEMPVFFEEHYVNFVQVDWVERVSTLDNLLSALDSSRSPGLCSPILEYYQ